MTLWVFPIEPLEERYSAEWMRSWPRKLAELGVPARMILGKHRQSSIQHGEFLDAIDTHYWKATQLAAFIECIDEVENGDVVLLHDAWNPALEALAYMRDTGAAKFKIAGMFHAGTYDPHDYLAQRGLGRWAAHTERGWLRALDYACVATEYHKDLLVETRERDARSVAQLRAKVHVTGFPLFVESFEWARNDLRSPIVVFPHRLAPEKNPQRFEALRDMYLAWYPDDAHIEWIKTKDVCASKDAYYSLLGSAKVAISFADQETWGIAMLEAHALGCYPIAPEQLSYPETLPPESLYSPIDRSGLIKLVRHALYAPTPAFNGARWDNAIETICRTVGVL